MPNKLHPYIVLWYQFSSAVQSCPTLCDPVDCNTPGFPVCHQLPELAQTHVHWIGDAIQPSHPLSPSHQRRYQSHLLMWSQRPVKRPCTLRDKVTSGIVLYNSNTITVCCQVDLWLIRIICSPYLIDKGALAGSKACTQWDLILPLTVSWTTPGWNLLVLGVGWAWI